AAPIRQIRTRFDVKDHACLNGFVARVDVGPSPRDAGILVHFEPQTVAGAVAEGLGETVPSEGVARRLVDVQPRRARTDRANRAIVCVENRAVDLAGPRGGFPN